MSKALRELLGTVNDPELIITPRLINWLGQHGDDATPLWVMERILEVATTPPRDRRFSFSSSSAGYCQRRQVYEYFGIRPDGRPSAQLTNLFNDGKWRHLRWQAMLLSAGILDGIEFPLDWPAKRSKGSMDGHGVVPDSHPVHGGREFGFELKGINPYGYAAVIKRDAPEEKHLDQVHRYFLSGGHDVFVIVYEDKATQNWKEFVIEEEPLRLAQQQQELDDLNAAIDAHRLPSRLPSCEAQMGPVFHDCPFGGKHGVCWKANRLPEVSA